MDFSKLNFGVDGDSITAGEQWSYHVYKELGMASHHNVAVGSSVWYKRTIAYSGGSVTTQDYTSPDFAAGRKLTTLLSFRREPTTALSFIPSALLKR